MELKIVGNMLENKGIKFLYNKKNPRKEPLFINMDFATLYPQPIRVLPVDLDSRQNHHNNGK